MHAAALEYAAGTDLVIASAAISDWRPETQEAQKRKKGDADLTVRMVRTPDILASIGAQKGSSFLVAFAAETENHEQNAREKLQRKHADAIAVNDVSNERGWGAQRNSLTLLWGTDGRRELGEAAKPVLAARLLDAVQELMCS